MTVLAPASPGLTAAQILALVEANPQAANTVLAGPTSGANANPAFRGLVSADLTTALLTPPPIGGTTAAAGIFAGLTINDPTTQTKQIAFNLVGAAAPSVLTIVSSQNASRSLTVPVLAANDTLATLAVAQTFTGLQTFSAGIVGSVKAWFNGAGAGALSGATTSEGSVSTIAAWDPAKHNLLAGAANTTTAKALCFALDQASSIAHIISLAPSVAWLDMTMWCGQFHVNQFGVGNTLSILASGRIMIGGDVQPSTSFPGAVLWGVQNGATDNPSAVGEIIKSAVTAIAAGATGVTKSITSITLTPGRWRMSSLMVAHGGATGLTAASAIKSSIVATTNTDGTSGDTMTQKSVQTSVAVANDLYEAVVPDVDLNLTATTTYYLTVNVSYTAGSPTVDGRITAQRIR